MDATRAEEWRPIPGYEGHYEASSLGRIRSLKTYRGLLTGRILRPTIGGTSRYPKVTLYVENRRSSRSVHGLVALAWLGSCPAGMEVRHLDDDPLNPQLINLSYGTRSQNTFDKVRRGAHPEARKTHCPQGHPYDLENTRTSARGKRACRACHRAWDRTRHRRRAAGSAG